MTDIELSLVVNHLAAEPAEWSPMVPTLYHYTARNRLASITQYGLCKGEVPITRKLTAHGIWLTTDRDPRGHGLGERRPMTDDEKRLRGIPVSEETWWDDKREVRLTVEVPEGDRGLDTWAVVSRSMSPEWRRTLESVGGGTRKSRTWYVYRGMIPPEWIIQVEDLSTGGTPAEWRPQDYPVPAEDVVVAVLPNGQNKLVRGNTEQLGQVEALTGTGSKTLIHLQYDWQVHGLARRLRPAG